MQQLSLLRKLSASTPFTSANERPDPRREDGSQACAKGRIATLQLALHSAIAQRRTEQLLALLQQQGPAQFADALRALTARQQADVLSLLTPQARADVYRHLPPSARRLWLQAADPAPAAPLRRRLLHTCQRNCHWLRAALIGGRA